MFPNREVLVGCAVGAGAVALAAGVYLAGRAILTKRKSAGSKLYETQKLLDEYVGFHYCPPDEYVMHEGRPEDALDFPKRCADLCLQYKPKGVLSRAIDIGCAVGRSTFELAREYDEVVGLDYSQAFIGACQELKITGQMNYSLVVEGELSDRKTATVDPSIDRSRVSFTVGDACDLPNLGQFGCVFAGNLICRLPEPMKFYRRLPDLIVSGGILFITSPYTWLESYTEKDKWIGGYRQGGVDVRGFSKLKEILDPDFKLILEQDMPFLIRETVRKHQWTVAHVTVWMRR